MPAQQKLYEGPALEPLLAEINRELGPRARIMRAEKTRQGGVMGFFAREQYRLIVEEPPPKRRKRSSGGRSGDEVARERAGDAGTRGEPEAGDDHSRGPGAGTGSPGDRSAGGGGGRRRERSERDATGGAAGSDQTDRFLAAMAEAMADVVDVAPAARAAGTTGSRARRSSPVPVPAGSGAPRTGAGQLDIDHLDMHRIDVDDIAIGQLGIGDLDEDVDDIAAGPLGIGDPDEYADDAAPVMAEVVDDHRRTAAGTGHTATLTADAADGVGQDDDTATIAAYTDTAAIAAYTDDADGYNTTDTDTDPDAEADPDDGTWTTVDVDAASIDVAQVDVTDLDISGIEIGELLPTVLGRHAACTDVDTADIDRPSLDWGAATVWQPGALADNGSSRISIAGEVAGSEPGGEPDGEPGGELGGDLSLDAVLKRVAMVLDDDPYPEPAPDADAAGPVHGAGAGAVEQRAPVPSAPAPTGSDPTEPVRRLRGRHAAGSRPAGAATVPVETGIAHPDEMVAVAPSAVPGVAPSMPGGPSAVDPAALLQAATPPTRDAALAATATGASATGASATAPAATAAVPPVTAAAAMDAVPPVTAAEALAATAAAVARATSAGPLASPAAPATPAVAPQVAPAGPSSGATLVDRLLGAGMEARSVERLARAVRAGRRFGDALVDAFCRVPAPPEPPKGPGTLLAVVGPLHQALAEATALAGRLGLAPADIAAIAPDAPGRGRLAGQRPASAGIGRARKPGAARGTAVVAATSSTPATGDDANHEIEEAARWVASRRPTSGTVVVIDAGFDRRSRSWAAHALAILQPDAVWASVDALVKPEDVTAWTAALGGVDALMVANTAASVSPASVLRTGVPVATLDGRAASPERWAATVGDLVAA